MSKMNPFRLLVSHEEAERILLEHCNPLKNTENISISQARGRVLAESITAKENVPPFDRSAVDGYAVIAEDTFEANDTEVVLKVIDVVHAGTMPKTQVTHGTCIQIATGAPVPPGANAVVMVEFTEQRDGGVLLTKPVYPGANLAHAGEDIKVGEVVLPAGDRLTPAKIGVLAALGMTETRVFIRPQVTIIPTGKEVVAPGKPLDAGKIYDVNSFTLEAILTKNGAQVMRHPIVTDDYDQLRTAVEEALTSDLIVMSGGSSVGEKDMMVEVLENMGEILFHGVQVKPGKPTLFAMVKGTPVVGMPGYPTSCLSNAYIFLIPVIRQMAHLPPYQPRTVTAKISKRVVSASGRKQFLTVRVEDGIAYPVYRTSGAITSMSRADGYIMLPVNLDVIEEGEEVEVTLFD
ncbi:MAG: molybdenum cofactor biosynthesis protein [Candidatus Thorarchaeota archaeon]|nr:molybdenum cofactor biosynthesis protein [Candidatus Thorarchaeota archaeon]